MAKVVGEKPDQTEVLESFLRKAKCCHGYRSQS